MATLDQVMEALRAADKAGNVEDARRLAKIAADMRSQRTTPMKAASAVGKGVNVGLAETLGAPVDLATAALNLIPGLDIQEPVGGSAQLRRGLSSIGMGFENIEDLPEGERPFAQGGRVVGQSVPFAAAPLAAARAGAQGPQVIQPIMEMARQTPGKFAVAEGSAAAGAAIGRGVAERVAPGNELAGAGAEIVGGLVSPIALLGRNLSRAATTLNRVRSTFSRTGREVAVGRRVRELLEEAGEDVSGVTRRLQTGGEIPGQRLTAGQRTGSPTLLAIERRVMRDIPGVDNEIRQRITDTTQALNRAYDLAVESGDPTIITQISRERERWFRGLLESRVTAARQRAETAAEGIAQTRGRADVSVSTRDTLEAALSDARAVERQMWGDIPRDVTIEPSGFNDAYLNVRSGLLEEESLPAPIEAFARRVQQVLSGESEEIVTSGDLLRVRSRLLEMQRAARSGAAPNPSLARRLGEMADGILDDLADIPGTDEARGFSRQLNNVFTRGEVGNILGFDPRGGFRVEPELTLGRALGPGGERAAVASRQIESAAQAEGLPGVTARSTLSDQEQFVRSMFAKAVDPQTGQVKPQALARIARENQELLGRFPGLRRAVEDAGLAQELVDRAARLEGQSLRAMAQRSAFAKVANFDDPVRAIGNILSGPRPLKDYSEIARIARDAGPQAQAGLRRATFDHLFSRSTDSTGLISGERLRAALETRLGDRTLLDTMMNTGVLDQKQARRLAKIIDRAEKFEDALKSGERIGELLENVTSLEDLFIRIAGANIGGHGAIGGSTGTPLVAAQAGSRFARRLFEKIPAVKAEAVLAEAVENPQLMARLLERSRSPGFKPRMRQMINAFLLQTGIPVQEDQ